MEFRILGPLDVVDGESSRVLPSGRQRQILALLLLHVDRVVSCERLIDALWGESPPSSARATLRTHIAHLRKALAPDGATLLVSRPPGYVLRLEPEQVDALRFQRLVQEGRDLLRSDTSRAADRLRQALALWRGEPLGDMGMEDFARADVARLVEQRWTAIEDYTEAELALGRHAALVGDLEALVSEQPLRERLWECLMVALYRSGRQAEALRAFQTARRRLAEELGVDPSPRLRQLESQVLRHDPALGVRLERQATVGSRPLPTGAPESGALPTGVVTFLLTDVEGSTRGWQGQREGFVAALRALNATIGRAVATHGGTLLKARGEGDSTFSVFERPADAVAAALELQRELTEQGEGPSAPLRVRVAVHSAEADVEDGDYVGLEIARAARLRDAAHGGQVVLSAATADLVAETLPSEVSLVSLGAPRLRDFDRPQPVYQLAHPDLPDSFPPLRAASSLPDLPVPLTALLGRERELAEVRALLDVGRLVTVVGTGGCGKTRLALEVAREAAGHYRNGVVLVELAPVTDPSTVLPAVAAALGVRDASGKNLDEQVRNRVSSLNLLLLLDNCEHLLPACAQLVSALLPAAPEVVILATSRQRLAVPGENSYPLAPLATPPPGDSRPDVVGSSPAVELFVTRARALDPNFRLSAENAPFVAQICRQLDGLPLAIELAAVAVRALGVAEVSQSLARRIDTVAAHGELRPTRHQSLWALIDWSYDLLSDSERELLLRLSVLAGTFDIGAAHAVYAEDGVDRDTTAAGLVRLVEQSLVVPDHTSSGARFRMLETIRAYGNQQLSRDEWAAARARQLAWALALAKETDNELRGADAASGLARLEQELDNLRQALEWGLSDGDPSMGVQLTSTLGRFWAMRGRISEGRRWLERARARIDEVPAQVAARWYMASGALAWVAGELHGAHELLDRALELQQACADDRGAVDTLFLLANMRRTSGDHRAAAGLYEKGLTLAESLGDAHNVATGKAGLGDIACARGDYERARRLYEDAVDSFRQTGGKHAMANALLNLATANRDLGRYDVADKHYREADAIFRSLEDRSCTAATLEGMAELAIASGEAVRAGTLYAESLRLRSALEQRAPLAVPLEGVAIDLASRGQWTTAVTLLGAADALRQERLARDPALQKRYDEALDTARQKLDPDAFDAAWSVGQRQDLRETVTLAERHAPA